MFNIGDRVRNIDTGCIGVFTGMLAMGAYAQIKQDDGTELISFISQLVPVAATSQFKVGGRVKCSTGEGVIISFFKSLITAHDCAEIQKDDGSIISRRLEDLTLISAANQTTSQPQGVGHITFFENGDIVEVSGDPYNQATVLKYDRFGRVEVIKENMILVFEEHMLRLVDRPRRKTKDWTSVIPEIDIDNSTKEEDDEKARMMAFFSRSAHDR